MTDNMKYKGPFFVTEIPLTVSPYQAQEINRRFRTARQLYNAFLAEALRRAEILKTSEEYKVAKKLATKTKDQRKDRAKMLGKVCQAYGFSKYDLQNYKTKFTKTWLNDQIGSKVASALAVRAFTAVETWLKNIRARPRFRPYWRPLTSLEHEPGNMSGIVWKGDHVYFAGGGGKKKLILKAVLRDDPVIDHALSKEAVQVRIIKKIIAGHERFFCQLTLKGTPYERYLVGQGTVGLDIGPQTVAIVALDSEFAELKHFCEELKDTQSRIARLQRLIARQQRENNPGHYNPDWIITLPSKKIIRKKGTNKKGKGVKGVPWVKSNRQIKNEAKIAEFRRKEKEHRKNLHNRLVNKIIQLGDTIKLEKISYRAFQKLFGRSVSKRAPGMFVERIRQKQIGGELTVEEFSTFSTKLSQTCQCGETKKKGQGDRTHLCLTCGLKAQRDLYSAYLAIFVESDQNDLGMARKHWEKIKPVLDFAWQDALKCGVPNA